MARKAAVPIPPRLQEDINSGGRNTKLFLQNVKERLKDLEDSVTVLNSAPATQTTATSTTTTVNTVTSVFSNVFESSEQTITNNSTITLTHGLGSLPKLAMLTIRCKTAELNYAVGDEVIVTQFDNDSAGNNRGTSIAFNISSLYIVIAGTNIAILDKSTHGRSAITNANWKFVARAWT